MAVESSLLQKENCSGNLKKTEILCVFLFFCQAKCQVFESTNGWSLDKKTIESETYKVEEATKQVMWNSYFKGNGFPLESVISDRFEMLTVNYGIP